jgi:hypothetical protein
MRFIATSVNYSPKEWNSMIIGDYCLETQQLLNAKMIRPPFETNCEKNWIPLVSSDGVEYFIYKWSPLQIGSVVDGVLNIVLEHPVKSSYFDRIRGSTTFIDTGNYLVGLVHLSEETKPRHYYHILVSLDKQTFRPIKYSQHLYFGKEPGVEFCIGFTIDSGYYCFWTSKMDIDPELIRIPIESIPFQFDF